MNQQSSNTNRNSDDSNEVLNFDEAISKVPYGIFHILFLIASGGCLMAVIIETLGMGFIIPVAKCDLNLNLSEKGALSTIGFLGVVSSSHLWGYIADTKGRKPVIVYTLIISSFFTFLSSFAPTAWSFILLRYLSGFFISGPSAVIYAYLGEFHSNKHRAVVMSLSASFIAIGMMIIPALAWLILSMEFDNILLGLQYKPWRLLMAMCGLPSLILGLLLLNVPESPKFLLSQGRVDEFINVLNKLYKWNTGKTESSLSLRAAQLGDEFAYNRNQPKHTFLAKICEQTVPLFKKSFLKRTLMISAIQFGIFAASSGHFLWFPQILNDVISSNSKLPSQYAVCHRISQMNVTINDLKNFTCDDSVDNSVFQITIVLGAMFTGFYLAIGTVVNFVGARYLVVFLLVTTGLAGISIPLWHDYWDIVIMYGIFLSAGTSVGVTNTIVVDLYPTKIRAMAMAISLMIGRLGAIFGSQVIGQLLSTNCPMAFYSFSIVLIVCAILVILLPTTNVRKKYVTHF